MGKEIEHKHEQQGLVMTGSLVSDVCKTMQVTMQVTK